MSRSTKASTIKKLLTVLAIGGGGVLGLIYIQAFAKIDPLLNMRRGNIKAPEEQGVRLGDVHFVQYDGEHKIAEAEVEHVFVTDDRRQYRLGNVKTGSYYTKEGKKINFSAPRAVWNATYKVLTANDGVRVWNGDIDLKTPNFKIDGIRQTLYAPGTIQGKFYKGDIKSVNLLYSIKTDQADFGPTEWTGRLNVSMQDDQKGGESKTWNFTSTKGRMSRVKGIQVFNNYTATDGEIIIKADKMEYDDKTEIVTATGNVQYFSPESNMACEKVVAYRKEKRAILTGAVTMLVKPKDKQTKAQIEEIPPFRPMVPKEVAEGRPDAPKPSKSQLEKQLDKDLQDPKSVRKYPISIRAEKIQYWYGKGNKHAIITGSPEASQELPGGRWRHVWAHDALYNGEAETLKMNGTPGQADLHYQSSNDDDVFAETATLHTGEDNDDYDIEGAKGKVHGNSDDDDGNNAGPPPPDPLKPGAKGNGKGKGKGGTGLQGPIGGGKAPA